MGLWLGISQELLTLPVTFKPCVAVACPASAQPKPKRRRKKDATAPQEPTDETLQDPEPTAAGEGSAVKIVKFLSALKTVVDESCVEFLVRGMDPLDTMQDCGRVLKVLDRIN